MARPPKPINLAFGERLCPSHLAFGEREKRLAFGESTHNNPLDRAQQPRG
ncbi:MAG: hypothetical protein J7641_19335 [Cyanobacteria bacterium SID2]|nr:hypothetical protein [Cyanobacteria bacterium SID2]MBP0004070.1 hypothetical protein [Cyanobacteria bacterium SBC]